MALRDELEIQGNWLFKYRGFLPGIILAIGWIVFLEKRGMGHTPESNNIIYETSCLFFSLIGLMVRIYTVGYASQNTSGRNTTEGQVADSLNTTGFYSIMRHPLYLGNFLMWMGVALLTENNWFIIAFIFAYWLYYERIMYAEEQYLEKKFGEAYRAWASSVPAFIPAPGLYRPSLNSFDFRKVLRNEKTGVLLIFLVFTLFDISGEWLNGHTHYNKIFIIGSLFAAMFYLAMKTMKYVKTRSSQISA